MVLLLFLSLVSTLAHSMDSVSASLLRRQVNQDDLFLQVRKDIMNVDVQSAICRIKPGLAVNAQDASGSYLLHWAVLKVMSVRLSDDWRSTIDSRIRVVDELLRYGADYTAQERDSKRTIFHILAYFISPESHAMVSYAFKQLFKCIARSEFSNQLTPDALVEKIHKSCACKDAHGTCVNDLVTQKKCMNFISAECIKTAYKLALAREVICY